MAEYTADIVARLVRRVLFDEWRGQMAAGYLTEAGLLAIRAPHRIRPCRRGWRRCRGSRSRVARPAPLSSVSNGKAAARLRPRLRLASRSERDGRLPARADLSTVLVGRDPRSRPHRPLRSDAAQALNDATSEAITL